jgi:hypothetical protein
MCITWIEGTRESRTDDQHYTSLKVGREFTVRNVLTLLIQVGIDDSISIDLEEDLGICPLTQFWFDEEIFAPPKSYRQKEYQFDIILRMVDMPLSMDLFRNGATADCSLPKKILS